VRLDSTYGKGHVRAGRGYLAQGDFYNARLQFRQALDLDSADKAANKVRCSGSLHLP
jgi:Tfp pilus assembly protein PilF